MESFVIYTIKKAVLNKRQFLEKGEDLIKMVFHFKALNFQRIKSLIVSLSDDVTMYFEFPYVDKVYRDSFYSYFSSKYKPYKRDCIRVSLFNIPVSSEDFYDPEKNNELKNAFLGYFIIRPMENHLLGRSFLSPKVFKDSSYLTALTTDQVMIGAHKLRCNGFPHIAQDNESMSCAESSVWMLMEYYSSRYKEYSPVLPSDITAILGKNSYKRLLPSEGLTIVQISMALRNFGFSIKVYYSEQRDKADNNTFYTSLYYYLESGIPVILGLQNGNKVGHAIIGCGHSHFELDCTKIECRKNIYFLNTGRCMQKIVVMDDNSIPYETVNYLTPCENYSAHHLNDLEIQYFSVPLYKRIYLDAKNAEDICYSILTDEDIGLDNNNSNNPYVLRLFLTSSNSFKFRFANNKSASKEMKEYLINAAFPKFIWICEISDCTLYKKNLANGILILDATGSANKSAITLYYRHETILDIDDDSGNYICVDKKWTNFNQYQNNLKGEWNNFTDN